MKNQKGITLIALIITIIVMLILVGVSVTVALDGGLFKTAENAADRTEDERDIELERAEGKVEIGESKYNSIEEYVNKGKKPDVPNGSDEEEPDLPSDSDEEEEEQDQLAGTWVFNETMTIASLRFTYDVNFTRNGTEYSRIMIEKPMEYYEIWYTDTECADIYTAYDEGSGWTSQSDRTITITSTYNEVTGASGLLAFLNQNATKQP